MTEPTAAPAPAPVSGSHPGKGLGIAGLILAILWPFQLIGLILSIIAKVQSKKAGLKNGPATAGIIVSIILLVVSVIITLAILIPTLALFGQCGDLGPGQHVLENGVVLTCG